MSELHWMDHLLIWVLVIGLPLNSFVQGKGSLPHRKDWASDDKIRFYWMNSAALWILVIAVVVNWWITGKDFNFFISVFFLPQFNLIVLLLVVAVVSAYFLELFWSTNTFKNRLTTYRRLSRQTPFLPSKKKEWYHYLGLAISAGICEEIVFRFYLLSYLEILLHNSLIALLITGFLFGVVHFYQGYQSMIKIGLLSLVFGWLFLMTNSLIIPIGLHIFIDIISGRFAYNLFR